MEAGDLRGDVALVVCRIWGGFGVRRARDTCARPGARAKCRAVSRVMASPLRAPRFSFPFLFEPVALFECAYHLCYRCYTSLLFGSQDLLRSKAAIQSFYCWQFVRQTRGTADPFTQSPCRPNFQLR